MPRTCRIIQRVGASEQLLMDSVLVADVPSWLDQLRETYGKDLKKAGLVVQEYQLRYRVRQHSPAPDEMSLITAEDIKTKADLNKAISAAKKSTEGDLIFTEPELDLTKGVYSEEYLVPQDSPELLK